jgi:hypothetical protein
MASHKGCCIEAMIKTLPQTLAVLDIAFDAHQFVVKPEQ